LESIRDFLFGVGWLAIFLSVITASIRQLVLWGRAKKINVIWYAFSLVLVIRFAVDITAYASGYQSLHVFLEQELGIPSKFTLGLHETLTNIRDEVLLIVAIIVITIAPQLVTYVLAGIFGCAQSPAFVWYFEKFAAWSLIKFLAALAGIVMEETISPTERPFPSGAQSAVLSLFSLALSFSFALIQTGVIDLVEGRVQPRRRVLWPTQIHRWFTRNLPPPEQR
jgi:hypothetical protein